MSFDCTFDLIALICVSMWIDTHAHLDKLKPEPETVLKEAEHSLVDTVFTIGTCLNDWPEVLRLSNAFPNVYGTLGMHPHEGKDFNEDCRDFLKKHLSDKNIVAVGEIGLDYYYSHSPKEAQKEAFYQQFCLAEEFQLPVEIHTRQAEEDTLYFLKEFRGRVKGLLHCFTSSYDMAKKALDFGFNISFSGILTFKKSEELQAICKKLPLDRIHIETDSPYLAPVPHRGKENQPAWVSLVAHKVCEIHNIEPDFLSEQLKQNTFALFPKIKHNNTK